MIHRSKTRLAVCPSLMLALLALWLPSRSSDAAKPPEKPKAAAVQRPSIESHSSDISRAVGMVKVAAMHCGCGIAPVVEFDPVAQAILTLVRKWSGFSTEGQVASVEEYGVVSQDTTCESDSSSVSPIPFRPDFASTFFAPEIGIPGLVFSCDAVPGTAAACPQSCDGPQSCDADVGNGEQTLPCPAEVWSAMVTESQRTVADCQILFLGPDGTQVHFIESQTDAYDLGPVRCPGRQNLPSAAIYRLRLTDVPGHPGRKFRPTLEIGPVTPRTQAYVAYNAVPIQFQAEDFRKACHGESFCKVVYLPDPEIQESALAGAQTLVSTQLEPSVDPIIEADRRGAILAILRFSERAIEKSVCEQPAPSPAATQPQRVVKPVPGRPHAAVPRQAANGTHPAREIPGAALQVLPDRSEVSLVRIPKTASQTSHNTSDPTEESGNAIHLLRAARHLEAAGRSELAARISKEALLATKLLQLEKLQAEIAELRSEISAGQRVSARAATGAEP